VALIFYKGEGSVCGVVGAKDRTAFELHYCSVSSPLWLLPVKLDSKENFQ